MSIISNKQVTIRNTDKSVFPIYDYLALDASSLEVNLQELGIKLSQLPPDHAKCIQALILHHSVTKDNNSAAIPYGGLMLTKNSSIRYSNLADLPKDLIQIIANYLDQAERLSN